MVAIAFVVEKIKAFLEGGVVNFSVRSDFLVGSGLLVRYLDVVADVGSLSFVSEDVIESKKIKSVTNPLSVGFFFRDFLEAAIDFTDDGLRVSLLDRVGFIGVAVSALSDMSLRVSACGVKILNPHIDRITVMSGLAKMSVGLKLSFDLVVNGRYDLSDYKMLKVVKCVCLIALAILIMTSPFLMAGMAKFVVSVGVSLLETFSFCLDASEFLLEKIEQFRI